LKEKIVFLQEEYDNKRIEYREKLDKIMRKNQISEEENKNHYKINEFEKPEENKNTSKFDKKNLNDLTNIFKKKPEDIVEEVIKDYSVLSDQLNEIFSDKVITQFKEDTSLVYLKYKDSQGSFRITDELYTCSDLLGEACNFFDLDPKNFRIYYSIGDSNFIINMTISIKSFLFEKRKEIGGSNTITLTLLPIKVFEDMQLKVYDPEEDKSAENKGDTQNLLKDIDIIEITLLRRIDEIRFYLFFLFIIFVYNLGRSKIQMSYYINHAYNIGLGYKKFFSMNQYGLENDFFTVRNVDDFTKWSFNLFSDVFQYPTGN
jgi:hypothetical protein